MSAVEGPGNEKTVCITIHSGRTLKYDHSGRSLWAFPFKRPMGARELSVLSDLKAGDEAILVSLNLPPAVSNHLMYMGFVPDAQIRMLRHAPAGDPTVYSVDGMVVALRHETAKSIQVKPVAQSIHQHEQPTATLAEEDDLDVEAQVGVQVGVSG